MNHQALIDAYAAQAETPRRWIAGLTPDQLRAHPIPGTWSIHALVVHCLDSDLIATHRMRRIAAEELPLLIGYDETAFAKQPWYDAADLAIVCDLFAVHRRFTAQWLATLPADAWARAGIHNQYGKITIADMVPMYIRHVDHHAKFLADKRRALGKPLN